MWEDLRSNAWQELNPWGPGFLRSIWPSWDKSDFRRISLLRARTGRRSPARCWECELRNESAWVFFHLQPAEKPISILFLPVVYKWFILDPREGVLGRNAGPGKQDQRSVMGASALLWVPHQALTIRQVQPFVSILFTTIKTQKFHQLRV